MALLKDRAQMCNVCCFSTAHDLHSANHGQSSVNNPTEQKVGRIPPPRWAVIFPSKTFRASLPSQTAEMLPLGIKGTALGHTDGHVDPTELRYTGSAFVGSGRTAPPL